MRAILSNLSSEVLVLVQAVVGVSPGQSTLQGDETRMPFMSYLHVHHLALLEEDEDTHHGSSSCCRKGDGKVPLDC